MNLRPARLLLVGIPIVLALLWPGSAAPEESDAGRAGQLNRQVLQLDSEGRYREAVPLAQELLAMREKALGRDHPDVAKSLDKLGKLYREQGRYTEAEPLFKRSLQIRKKALPPDHPDLAESVGNLASLYLEQGHYAEAEPLLKRSLDMREKALGPEHPDVAESLSDLASLYRQQGRYAEAEPLFKRGLAIREKVLGPDNPNVAYSLNGLGSLYLDQGRYAEAEPLYQRTLAIREKALPPEHPDLAAALGNLALLYREQGRFAEAEPLFKRALAISEKARGPDHPDVATHLDNLAGLYHKQGRYADAESLFKRSLVIREKAFGQYNIAVATSLNNLAELYIDQGRGDAAELGFKRAVAIIEKVLGPHHPDVANGLNNLAELYRQQGRYAEAKRLFKRSLAISEKVLGPDHPDVATALNNLALLNEDQGRYAEAERIYKRSLGIREKALGPDHPLLAQSLNNLVSLSLAQGQIAGALAFSRRTVGILGKRLGEEPSDRVGTDAERRQDRFYFMQNVALLTTLDEPTAAAESFRVAQFASMSSVSRAVAGMAARLAAGSDALALVVRQRQDLAQRWQELDAAIVKATGEPSSRRNPAAETELREQLAAAAAELDTLDARIARDFPQYAELSNPKPLEIADAQALLAPEEAMLVYLVGGDNIWLWALRKDSAQFLTLDLGKEQLSDEVTALRAKLDPDLNPDLAPFDAERAHALYEKIVAPAADLLAGAHEVFVVPDGALESLPFEVLVTKPPAANPQSAADHRNIAWLAREHAVTVLPSVGSLRALRLFSSRGRAPDPFVGIGNPVLQGQPGTGRGVKLASLFRGAEADVDAVRNLPALPETADELRTVAKEMGAGDEDLYLGERASEPVLRQAELDRFRVVEFATHGLMSGDLKGLAEPALVLTPPKKATPDNDGLLTASKVATLKLDADWVVLSACNTAAGDGAPDAGGLSGLAKAFFYAGARSLLVSHWGVPSKATVKLITGTFDELKQHPTIGRAEALRRAEMAMLDPENPEEFAHPLAWAPFVLAGEGGAGR